MGKTVTTADVRMELKRKEYLADCLQVLVKEIEYRESWLNEESGYLRDENGEYILDEDGNKVWGNWPIDVDSLEGEALTTYMLKQEVHSTILTHLMSLV